MEFYYFFYVFGKNKTLNKFADAGFYGASDFFCLKIKPVGGTGLCGNVFLSNYLL